MNTPHNEALKERIEQLKMKNATGKMNMLGRLLVDNREMSIWEHDTKTLPWGARRWRRKALKFAREYIRPLAPEADLHPHDYDPNAAIDSSGAEGIPDPAFHSAFGTASILPYLQGHRSSGGGRGRRIRDRMRRTGAPSSGA